MEEYMNISVYMITWDATAGTPQVDFTPMYVHKCKPDEKNFRKAEANSATAIMFTYLSNLYCFDYPNDWEIKGTKNSQEGTLISINFSKCRGPTCRTSEEIDEYLKNYSIVKFTNSDEYQPSKYGSETIKRTIKYF